MTRLGIRRRLFLVVIATVTIAVALMVVGFNLLLARTLSNDIDRLARSRAASALTQIRSTPKGVTVGEAPDAATPDNPVWIFAGGRTLESPSSAGSAVNRAARSLAVGPARFVDVQSSDTRLYAAPVMSGGRRIGTVVAGVSLAPYEQTRRTALIGSLVLGLAVLALVALMARWLLASSLRPVARMTRQAAAWSEHDLDGRFGLGEPHDELTELAATLDALLDRLAASLRREQRFSVEVSHELRTPLARVLAETEVALNRDRTTEEYRQVLTLVHGNAEQLRRTVDALLAAARQEAGTRRGTADALDVAKAVSAACAGLAIERGLEVTIVPPPRPIRMGVEPELAERILQPVIENACRYGRQEVRVAVERDGGSVRISVGDDGPGVGAEEAEHIFEPGAQGNGGRSNGSGAGLGLALARRLARGADGDVEVVPEADGGRFVIHLPLG
jgi:two-component system, OmpR family, sensor kinase